MGEDQYSRYAADVGVFVNGNFLNAIRLSDVSINSDTHPEGGYLRDYEPIHIAIDPNEWHADDVANVVISSFQDIFHKMSKKESEEQASLSEEAINKWEELIKERC